MPSSAGGKIESPQQQGVAAHATTHTAAAVERGAVRNATVPAVASNNIDVPSKGQPQQRKGRPKKKRGKSGGGMCASDGPSVAAAAGIVDGPPKHQKKRRQRKKQPRKQRQESDHGNDTEDERRFQLRGPEQQRDQMMAATRKAVVPDMVLPAQQKNAAPKEEGAQADDGVAKTLQEDLAKDVAPFECSWTNALGGWDNDNGPTGCRDAVPLAGVNSEEGSCTSNSGGSFQSFQVGEEDAALEVRASDHSGPGHAPPNGVSLRPSAVNEELRPNDIPSEGDDRRRLVERNEIRDGDEGVEALTSDVATQRCCARDKGQGKDPQIERERHDGNDDEGRGEGGALSSPYPPQPPLQQISTERRQRVRFAMDAHDEHGVGGVGNKGKGNGEAQDNEGGEGQEEETALLLPSNVSALADSRKAEVMAHSQTQQHLRIVDPRSNEGSKAESSGEQRLQHLQPGEGARILQGTTSNAVVEDEDSMLDDIDDESSSLLNPSHIASASDLEPAGASQSGSTMAFTAGAASSRPASLATPSSTAVTEIAAGASVSSAAGEVAASGATPATPAAPFNYYELPPAPKDAVVREDEQRQPINRPPAEAVARYTEGQKPSSPSHPGLPIDEVISGGIWAAVRTGDTAGVRAKLAAGATIDDADSEGRTPLMVACASGATHMVTLLVNGVSPPASVAARTIEGWTPLMIASGGGRLEVVKVLLQAGASLYDRDDEFGSNSFMWACGGGHSDVVRLMLQQNGAKDLLLSTNADMWTSLMVACDAGSLETVRVLVEAGGDLGAFNSEGLTALDIAAGCNHLLLVCYLRTEEAFSSAQFWAAADSGNATSMSNLLRGNGHLVAALDKDGRSALLRTCIGGHLEVAKILVEAGADVDFQDSSGTSPLSVAAVVGDKALARYLVQAGGARLTLKNGAGWTPLMQAVAKGDLVMTRYLVDRGAAVNDGSPGGESVLDMARRFSSPELQRYLAAKGGFSSQEVQRQIGEVNDGGRGLFRFW